MHKLFVDFNNLDSEKRVRLNANGTKEDIKSKNIKFENGMEIILDDYDGLVTKGIIEFSKSENIWVGRIQWND